MLWYITSQGYIKGHTEYCEHSVNDATRIRLAFTSYAEPAEENGHQIDPNNWRNDPLAYDYMNHYSIIIPHVDYEISLDGGNSWNVFWRYSNQPNDYPWCDALGLLDEDNFWVWTGSWIAVTHDGGDNWLIHNGRESWNTIEYMNIMKVNFDTPDTGRIVFYRWRDNLSPTLLTTDGGKTWHP
jgi:hypothetical protein